MGPENNETMDRKEESNTFDDSVEREKLLESKLPDFFIKWRKEIESSEQELGRIHINEKLRQECEDYLRTIVRFEVLFDKGTILEEHMAKTTEILENDFNVNEHGMKHIMFVVTTAVLTYLSSRALIERQSTEKVLKTVIRIVIGAGFHDIGYAYCLPKNYKATEEDRKDKSVFDDHAQLGAQTMEIVLSRLRELYEKHPSLALRPFIDKDLIKTLKFTEEDIDRITEAIAAHDTPDHDDEASIIAYLRAIHATACAILIGDKAHISGRAPRGIDESNEEELLTETKSAIHKRLTLAITSEELVIDPIKSATVLELKVDIEKLKNIGYTKEKLIEDIQKVFSKRYQYLSLVTRSLFRTKRRNNGYIPFSIAFDFGTGVYPTEVNFEKESLFEEPAIAASNDFLATKKNLLINSAVGRFWKKEN